MKSKPQRYLPGEPRRVRPPAGQQLTWAVVSGPWYLTCYAGCLNVFSIAWSTPAGECWAPLHDFTPADQQRVIESCRRYDDLYDPDRLPPAPPRRLN